MKINLLVNLSESLKKGPGRRALNLILGLDRINIDFDICSSDYDLAIGMQSGCVFNRVEDIPDHMPIGPNVIHDISDRNDFGRFKNFVVQSKWVENYWKWHDFDETKDKNFYIYPASVDMKEWDIKEYRKPVSNCLFYTKYQSKENKEAAEALYKKRCHTVTSIEYGKYTRDDLKKACVESEYCIFNSCCEKSSNALMEILATGLPVYVIDSKRWIGDDKFDMATSAPDFSDECGVIGDFNGTGFDEFYNKVKKSAYAPDIFVKDGYTVEKIALKVVDIIKKCYDERSL